MSFYFISKFEIEASTKIKDVGSSKGGHWEITE